jgi:hypothetical protein
MDKALQEHLTKTIEALAQKLGVAAHHVYEVLVRQMVAEGIVYGIIQLAAVVVCIWLIVICIKTISSVWKDNDRYDFLGMCIGLGVLAAIIGLISFVFLSCAADNALKAINPEYYAIKTITNMVKSQ